MELNEYSNEKLPRTPTISEKHSCLVAKPNNVYLYLFYLQISINLQIHKEHKITPYLFNVCCSRSLQFVGRLLFPFYNLWTMNLLLFRLRSPQCDGEFNKSALSRRFVKSKRPDLRAEQCSWTCPTVNRFERATGAKRVLNYEASCLRCRLFKYVFDKGNKK